MFTSARIVSKTRPNHGTGLLEFHNTQNGFSREYLESLHPSDIGFFADDLVDCRDTDANKEEFILQAGVHGHDWVDIKPIAPASGADPMRMHGECAECDMPLTKSEAEISPYCADCV